MYYDKLISLFSAGEKPEQVGKDKLISKKMIVTSGSDHAYILFPAWGQPLPVFLAIQNRILAGGFSCLEYSLHKAVLTSDLVQSDFYWQIIKSRVNQDISILLNKGVKTFTFVGISYGTALAIYFANQYPMVTRLILTTPFNCYAEVIWSSVRLKMLKQRFLQKGYSLANLKHAWYDVLPENNLDNLFGKKIFINISRSDMVAPYQNGLKLVKKMRSLGLKVSLVENQHLGHYLTAAKYYLFPEVL